MMTLGDVRDRLRIRLEDSSGTPLWTDATLDEGLRRALDDYSQWNPVESTTTFTATAGATSQAVPAGAKHLVRIVDPTGWVIPEKHGLSLRYAGDEELCWMTFGGTIFFARPLAAGDYTIWSTGARAWPAAEDDVFPVDDSDLSLIVAIAAVYALEVRGTQEWKRGPLPAGYAQAILDARTAYASEWRERRRMLRARTLESTN
ncbi:MAG TPA: hypothetical protein VHV31_10850 [Nitrolancea sp.]|nr:hypothetical protein [Nitrolancea sp.]